MRKGLNFRLLVVGAAVVIILAASIFTWQRESRLDPQSLFWQALQSNLTETGLTCTIVESDDTSSSRQALSLDLASKADVRAVVTLQQKNSSVTTEQLSTTKADYVRYVSIDTAEKSASGGKQNFAKVLNVWSKTTPDASSKSTLFGRTALGNCIVPLAHLKASGASGLIAEAKKNVVFKTDFTASRRQELNKMSVQVYEVTVQPRPYFDFMKQVAKASGLSDLDAVDASTFDTKTAAKLTFYVDRDSGRLLQISFAGAKHTVGFSDYGKEPTLNIPKQTISGQELQQRLAAVR